MKPTDCISLENSTSFKGKYLRMTSWWKTPLIIAPILILFTGIVGLIYCLKADLLLSLYALPYIATFLLGTIWFKALKKYLFKSKLDNSKGFKVCISSLLKEDKGYSFLLFSIEHKRHNEHFINKIKSEIANEDIDIPQINKGQASLITNIDNTNIYITKIQSSKLKKSIADIDNKAIPLLFIDDKNIFIILKKDQIC